MCTASPVNSVNLTVHALTRVMERHLANSLQMRIALSHNSQSRTQKSPLKTQMAPPPPPLQRLLLDAVVPAEAPLQRREPVGSLVRLGDGGHGVGRHAHTHHVPTVQLLPLLAIEADPGRAARVRGQPQLQLRVVG